MVTWSENYGDDYADPTDLLCLVTTNEKRPIVMKGLAFTRDSNQAAIQLPYGAGETIHVYVFFQDAVAENFSESFHALVTIPSEPNP